MGRQRYEPITYWAMLGDEAVVGRVDTKVAQMRYGFKGVIPDGLIFRVSSIERESSVAFALQQNFVNQFISAVSRDTLTRMTGLRFPGERGT